MKLIGRMLATALAAGLASACSDKDSCPEYYDDPPRPVLFVMQLAGTTPLYYDKCQLITEVLIDGIAYSSRLSGAQIDCQHEIETNCVRYGLSSDWNELGHTSNAAETWQGLIYEKTQKPARCRDDYMDEPLDCWRGVAPPLGPMQVRATMYATKSCTKDDACAYGDPVSTTTDFVFDQDESVKLLMSP